MPVERVDVRILYCGQGMTNWIEYYAKDTDTAPSALAIVDLGGKGLRCSRAATKIASRLESFPADKRNIDAIVISHQDDDHWRLIPDFLTKTASLGVTAEKVFLGGKLWGVTARATVQRLCRRTGARSVGLPNYSSSYFSFRRPTGSRSYGPLLKQGRFALNLVLANAPIARRTPSAIKNGTSAVVAVELGNNSVILPGDATFETMNVINQRIYAGRRRPGPCFGLSLPHHGALPTSVEGYASKKALVRMSDRIISRFRDNLAPREIAASAGPRNSYRHPCLQVIETFEKFCTDTVADHYLQAFDYTNSQWDKPLRDTPSWTTAGFTKQTDSSGKVSFADSFDDILITLKSTGFTSIRRESATEEPAPRAAATAPPPTEAERAAHAARIADAAG